MKKTTDLLPFQQTEWKHIPLGAIQATAEFSPPPLPLSLPGKYQPASLSSLFTNEGLSGLIHLNQIVVTSIKGRSRQYELVSGRLHWQLLVQLGLSAETSVRVQVLPSALPVAEYVRYRLTVELLWRALQFPYLRNSAQQLFELARFAEDKHPDVLAKISSGITGKGHLTRAFIEQRLMGLSSGAMNRSVSPKQKQQVVEAD